MICETHHVLIVDDVQQGRMELEVMYALSPLGWSLRTSGEAACLCGLNRETGTTWSSAHRPLARFPVEEHVWIVARGDRPLCRWPVPLLPGMDLPGATRLVRIYGARPEDADIIAEARAMASRNRRVELAGGRDALWAHLLPVVLGSLPAGLTSGVRVSGGVA